MIVYVSSPYSAPTPEEIKKNLEFATEVGKQLLLIGHIPLIPHLISAFWDYDERFKHFTHNDWLDKFAKPLLTRAEALVLAGEWQNSAGCLIELKFARKNRMPVFTYEPSLRGLLSIFVRDQREKPTVKMMVLKKLIDHYPQIKNYTIEYEPPKLVLSGCRRLRELYKEGIVNYRYDAKTKSYIILTPKEQLEEAYTKMGHELATRKITLTRKRKEAKRLRRSRRKRKKMLKAKNANKLPKNHQKEAING